MPIYNYSVLEMAKLDSSTGWLAGGEITINADPTKFDVSEVTGVIVDSSDPLRVVRRKIKCPAQIGVDAEHLATVATSFLYVDENCQLVQSTVFPDSPEVRTMIQLGSLVHPDNTTITGTSQFLSAPVANIAASLNDLQVALGVINKEGNVFSGNSGTRGIDKTAGRTFYFGINLKNNQLDPNHKLVDAGTQLSFIRVWKDGSGGFNTDVSTAVTGGVYDDGTGGASAPTGTLQTNSWTNSRVFYSPDAATAVVQYGQNSYNTAADALAARVSESFDINPALTGVPIRATITHRGGATDFSNSGDAIFTEATPFGGLLF